MNKEVLNGILIAAIIGLVAAVINERSVNAVQATKIQHLENKMPDVTEALKEHTKAINELRVVIERMKKND